MFQLKPWFLLGTERQKVAKTAFSGNFWPFMAIFGLFLGVRSGHKTVLESQYSD